MPDKRQRIRAFLSMTLSIRDSQMREEGVGRRLESLLKADERICALVRFCIRFASVILPLPALRSLVLCLLLLSPLFHLVTKSDSSERGRCQKRGEGIEAYRCRVSTDQFE